MGTITAALTGGAVLAQTTQPGIYLDLDEIRTIANRVRGGRSLQPETWPNGARVAVLFSFDVDNDTITIARNEVPSIGAMSQGEYGARVGLRRVVDLMDRHEIPASFFIPAVSLVLPGGEGGRADRNVLNNPRQATRLAQEWQSAGRLSDGASMWRQDPP